MKLIMFPLLFSLGFIAYENRDKIADQYYAAYPSDPAKAAALDQCIGRNRDFNRLDGDDRKQCYRRYLAAAAPVPLAPAPSPYYAYSPSHLAGDDIRRREANESYHPGGLISSAEAAPLPKPAASVPVAAHPHQAARPAAAHAASAAAKHVAAAQSR